MEVHHVGYLVTDIDRSLGHFILLGFDKETNKQYDEYRDIYILFLVNGAMRVELVQPASERSEFYGMLKKFKNLPYHICYITNNMSDSINMFKKEGFALTQSPQCATAIDNRKVAFLLNPDIGIIELLENV